MNNFGKGKKTRLSRVYFVWTIRDFGSAECQSPCNPVAPRRHLGEPLGSLLVVLTKTGRLTVTGFHSLLQAIEAEHTEGRIEIHIYLTAKIECVHISFASSLPISYNTP